MRRKENERKSRGRFKQPEIQQQKGGEAELSVASYSKPMFTLTSIKEKWLLYIYSASTFK